METEQNILTIRGLQSYFFTDSGAVPAVDGVDLDIPRGRIVGLVGESGCGKSMTAKSIMGCCARPGALPGGRSCLKGATWPSCPKKSCARSAGRTSRWCSRSR